jgi:hypothetical protein
LAVFAARRADAVCLAMGHRLHRCDGGNRWIGMVEFGDGGAAALAANIARMGHGKGWTPGSGRITFASMQNIAISVKVQDPITQSQ